MGDKMDTLRIRIEVYGKGKGFFDLLRVLVQELYCD
jgi:hypothetical protein